MKKGFTLIEVIGVLILLAAIALIAVPSIEQQIKEGKQKLYDSQITAIKLDAQNWLSDNLIYKPNNGEVITIMLAQLKQGGYVDENVTNPITKELFPNDMLITITNNDGIITYDVLTNTGSDKTIYDSDTPLIILSGNVITNVELNSTYTDLGATASINGKNITDHITTTGSVNTSTIGSYSITYTVNYNNKTNYFVRTVNVVDRVAPVITVPSTEISIPDNELVNTSVLNDVTVTDNSGAYTLNIKSDLSTIAGIYTVTYEATDASGNKSTQTRKVTVIKSGNPIFVFGKMTVTINEGDTYDLMTSVNAIDANGYNVSNVTCSINGSACNTTSLGSGTYTVNYIATDSNGHSTTASRTLIINKTLDIIVGNFNVTKGVNIPQLTGGMTPIKWVDGVETTTTSNDPDWYDYSNKLWANAKTADGSYWVWIPRYAYKISTGWHTNTTGTIDVVFLKNDTTENSSETIVQTSGYDVNGTNTSNAYFLEPAFQNETGNTKYGFWVAKFEPSVSDTNDACYTDENACNKTTLIPKIVPNVSSWIWIDIGNIYTVVQNMSSNTSYGWTSGTVDTHMMTNYEWGTVAYLTQSSYGKNSEVWINNSNEYITGCAGDSVSDESNNGCPNAYNTTIGVNASTTGNITGIYDMVGGADEYVAAYVNNGSSNLNTYGSNIVSSTLNKNVYNVGSTDNATNNYNANKNIYGDAIYEISSSYSGANSWNNDASYMPYSSDPWFFRDGGCYNATATGIFYFYGSTGDPYSSTSFRIVSVLK